MTISLHARNIANDLERAASCFVANPDRGLHMTLDAATHHADTLRGAAALIRDLASNQLPDFDSIQPATPEPRAAEVVQGWANRAGVVVGAPMAARLSLAAAWIKARDQEIAQLRTALSRVQEPPQAFERDPALPHGFDGWRKLGEYLDARKLGAPVEEPAASDLQSQLAPLLAIFERQSQAQAEHWRALEFQTRRIADANALRALMVVDALETGAGDLLLTRVRADALK